MRRLVIALALLLMAAPAHAASPYVWLTPAEINAIDSSGTGWSQLITQANLPVGTPNLSNINDNADIKVLAKALAYVRRGTTQYQTDVRAACMAAIGTEADGTPASDDELALGRNLLGYVIGANLVGMAPADTQTFNNWLRACLTEDLGAGVHLDLITTHEQDPNNWGTRAGSSRAAVCIYLGLTDQLTRCANVFKGWTGDSATYDGFVWDNDLSWQANQAAPRAVNAPGGVIQGHDVSGALPEEMRRGSSFAWPPAHTIYAWEGLNGAIIQAEILHRQGYDSWNWSTQAILRAARFLWNLDVAYGSWWATGDDTAMPWIINRAYGTEVNFTSSTTTSSGKSIAWTSWTHQPIGCSCRLP